MDTDKFEFTKFSYGTLLFLIALCLFVGIVCCVNAVNFNNVLSDTNDENIGDNRGSVIWYYWLNVVLSIIAFLLVIYFAVRLFTRQNVYSIAADTKLYKALKSESSIEALRARNQIKECSDLGLDTKDCEDYQSKSMYKDKVEFYLEKSRYIADSVNSVDSVNNIRSEIYNKECFETGAKNAKECILKNIKPKYSDELYKDALTPDVLFDTGKVASYLTSAKTASENLIKSSSDVKALDTKIKTESEDIVKKDKLEQDKETLIKRKLNWSK